MNVADLPAKMSDENSLRAMSPEVQQACKQFEDQVVEILYQNDLELTEFQTFQRRMKNDWFFRRRVQQQLKSSR